MENEFITAFRMNFGTVAGKFCSIDIPKYQVLVPLNVTKELRNVITLSAITDGKPVSDQDETITRLEIPKKEETENKAPQKPMTPEKVKKTETEQKETEIKIPDQVADTGDRNPIVQWAILMGMIGIGMITLKKKSKKSQKP